MYDGRAVEEADSWDKFKGPTKDFNEAVYCVETHGDAAGKTVVALVNKAADKGVSIRYDTKKLPAFSLWKNTDTLKEGYVTGLEPGTSFCYPKAHEKAQGRVPTLAPGASVSFEVDWNVLRDSAAVEATKTEIAKLSEGKPTEVAKTLAFYKEFSAKKKTRPSQVDGSATPKPDTACGRLGDARALPLTPTRF